VTPLSTEPRSGLPAPAGALRRQLTLTDPMSLFLRPPVAFARVTRRFRSAVTLSRGSCRADGREPLDVVLLGAPHGAVLTVEVSGPDAAAALEALLRVPFVSEVFCVPSDG
jgi:phosphocarrier protein HPr